MVQVDGFGNEILSTFTDFNVLTRFQAKISSEAHCEVGFGLTTRVAERSSGYVPIRDSSFNVRRFPPILYDEYNDERYWEPIEPSTCGC